MGLRSVGALMALLVACGARSRLELGSSADGQGATAGTEAATGGSGGVAAASSGGVSGFGATSGTSFTGGTFTGGSSTGGTSTGGSCSSADFNFTADHDVSLAYMIDHGHTGAQLGSPIEPPLGEIWRHRYDGAVSYPIAYGLVYVAVGGTAFFNRQEVFSTRIDAIDPASGEIVWEATLHHQSVGGPFTAHLAYDRGILFAATQAGTLFGLDAANGDVLWEVDTDVDQLASAPIASGGAVFVTGNTGREDASFALDACDGHTVWRGQANGPGGHPTLGGNMLFSTGDCDTTAVFAKDGTSLWGLSSSCTAPGGGERTVYHLGVLYAGEFGTPYAIDVNSGDPLEAFELSSSLWPPSVAGEDVVFRSSSMGFHWLEVFGSDGAFPQWSVSLPGYPWLPVLLTRSHAFVFAGGDENSGAASEKYLYAVDLRERDIVWQSAEPTVPSDPEWAVQGDDPLPGIAASEGRIFVSYQNQLVAYEPYDAPEGFCGDGIVQANESCDGPTPEGTSCGDTCQIVFDGVMLAAGNYHTCGLRRDRSVTCWGVDGAAAPPGSYQYISANEGWAAGVLTDGSPVFWGRYALDFSAIGTFTKLEAGTDSFCGLDQAGVLTCGGAITTPTDDRRYTELSVWDVDLCAITRDGDLYCFGDPTNAPREGVYRAVALGNVKTCAIRDDRTISCFANPWPAGEFTAVTSGFGFHCGIKTDGELDCWGSLTARDGSILQPPPGKFSLIDAGWQHVCAVRVDGVTLCWGANEDGQATPPGDFP